MNWSTCSPEIILLILKTLDHKSLVNCLSVCKLWRDVVDHFARVNGIWPNLARIAMYNEGIAFKQKSVLPWRDLYFNSLLWNKGNIHIQLDKIILMDCFKDMHIFEDNITIVLDCAVKHYKVDTLIRFYEEMFESGSSDFQSILDYQETQYMTGKLLAENDLYLNFGSQHKEYTTRCSKFKLINDYYFMINSVIRCSNAVKTWYVFIPKYKKADKMRTYNGLGAIRGANVYNDGIYVLKLVEDRCYVIDTKNVLSLIKWNGNNVFQLTMMRCYERVGSICAINIFMDEVYVLKQNGNIVRADDWHFVGKTIGKINSPNFYNSPSVLCMFLKHSVVYSVFGPKSMKISEIQNTGEIVVECSGLSCATSHGDMLFLGYKDGKVSAYLAKKMLSSNEPHFTFNIKDIANCTVKESEVKAIEVYEANESHYLFIATRYELIKVIVSLNE